MAVNVLIQTVGCDCHKIEKVTLINNCNYIAGPLLYIYKPEFDQMGSKYVPTLFEKIYLWFM